MKGGRVNRDTIFIDTNLLLVLLVGTVNPAEIERFKRTKAYTTEDYRVLVTLVGKFRRILTTPHVLTEVSNLSGNAPEPLRRKTRLALARFIEQSDEHHLPSKELVVDPRFPLLGLADVSILRSVAANVTVLTADLPLYNRLASAGVDAINYNHLRSGSWS